MTERGETGTPGFIWRRPGFPSMRGVRVIDSRSEGMPREERDAMVEEHLDRRPPETQSEIVTQYAFASSELIFSPRTFRKFMRNTEFGDPSPTML